MNIENLNAEELNKLKGDINFRLEDLDRQEREKLPVRIFKCPCEGFKYKLAGKPNEKPTLKEKREYGEYIAARCTVITIPLKQFKEEDWEWCPKHFDKK